MATDFRKDIPSKNEGEGSKSAAKAYNKDQQDFAESGKVDAAAQDARKAIDGAEKDSLKAAEAKGRAHSRGEDPALNKKSAKH